MIPKFRAWDRLRKEMNYKVMVGNCDLSDENWTCPIIWIEEKKDWLHLMIMNVSCNQQDSRIRTARKSLMGIFLKFKMKEKSLGMQN